MNIQPKLEERHEVKNQNKMKSVLWLAIIAAISLTACAGFPGMVGQQINNAGLAGNPVIDTAKLRSGLLYYMVNDVVTSSELAAMDSVVTMQGEDIMITSPGTTLVLNDTVNIIEQDIVACNGKIHVIDQMLVLPGELTQAMEIVLTGDATSVSCQDGQSIADILNSQERFSLFVEALKLGGLMDMLDQDGGYTVFAPPNSIFVMPVTDTADEITNGKITICHATGSEKNPYVEITVDVNGLNGHDKHPDDIIPAPAGGCPTVAIDKKNKK